MFDPPDYSIIDREGLVRTMFYPRRDWSPPPRGASEHMVPVEGEVLIAARFYPCAPNVPSILFFHGNGEVVSDYDDTAPLYTAAGINLMVADFRGYGMSGGRPAFAAMLSDAHAVSQAFHRLLDEGGYDPRRFLMGRSLGAHSAIELAAHEPERWRGLITESGTARISRMVSALASQGYPDEAEELDRRHTDKLRSISIPTLILHGTRDELVSIDQAYALFETLTVEDKRLVPIDGAGHNDILWTGMAEYFGAIREFVKG